MRRGCVPGPHGDALRKALVSWSQSRGSVCPNPQAAEAAETGLEPQSFFLQHDSLPCHGHLPSAGTAPLRTSVPETWEKDRGRLRGGTCPLRNWRAEFDKQLRVDVAQLGLGAASPGFSLPPQGQHSSASRWEAQDGTLNILVQSPTLSFTSNRLCRSH